MAVKVSSFSLLSLFLLIINGLSKESSTPVREFVCINRRMMWYAAQKYCREHHTDLATVRNSDDAELLLNLTKDQGWIGLFQRFPGSSWRWSEEDRTDFTPFELLTRKHRCKYYLKTVQKTVWCHSRRPFFCYDEMFLVKENKSWGEALEHCGSIIVNLSQPLSQHENNECTLASLKSEENLRSGPDKIQEALTDQVWIGLHFLVDQWLWVNGKPLNPGKLPLCPAHWQHCGTLSKNNALHLRDCMERRNFLCHRMSQQAMTTG